MAAGYREMCIATGTASSQDPKDMQATAWFFRVCADRYYARWHRLPQPPLPPMPKYEQGDAQVDVKLLPMCEEYFAWWIEGSTKDDV